MKKEREKQILELVRQQQLELLKHTFLSLLTVTYSVPREYMKLKSNHDYQEFYEELLSYFKTIDAKHPIIANKYEEMQKTPEGRQDMIDLYAEILEHLYRVDYQAPSDPWKILIHLQTMNRIDTHTHRQDLADRSLIFNLPQIEDKDRRPECQFLKAFEQARPRILGALLDAVSMALKNIDKVKLPAPPGWQTSLYG